MTAAAWVCLFSPLAAAVLITLGGTRLPRRVTGYLATASVAVAFVAAVVDFFAVIGRSESDQQQVSTAWTWLEAGSFNVGLSVLVDPLSVFMMLVVSGVGFLILAYAIGYMDGDDEERRYHAYKALFVFSMLLLVQAGNLLLLLAGWGMVGLSSYLLINFWHFRATAVAAGKKAFIMNAFGDATFALALFLLIQRTGSVDFDVVFSSNALPHGSTVACPGVVTDEDCVAHGDAQTGRRRAGRAARTRIFSSAPCSIWRTRSALTPRRRARSASVRSDPSSP